MRAVLFFDLPTLTSTDQRNYRVFRKNLIKIGFFMLQESVYVKMSIDMQSLDSSISKIKKFLPPKGSVIILRLTEKQFSSKLVLLGNDVTDVVSSDERVVIL